MKVQTKIITLSALTGVLALVFVLSLFFSGDKNDARKDMYTWLDKKAVPNVTELKLSTLGGTRVELSKVGDDRFLEKYGEKFPAKNSHIADFLSELSKEQALPVRSTSVASQASFKVDGAGQMHVTALASDGTPLLDLILGGRDLAQKQVYMRKSTSDEVRLGSDSIANMLEGNTSPWYELSLFNGRETPSIALSDVQRVRFFPPPADPPEVIENDEDAESPPPPPPSEEKLPLTLVRDGTGWKAETDPDKVLDKGRVESYLQTVLTIEADDFLADPKSSDSSFSASDSEYGRIYIELGNGTTRTINLGAKTGSSGSKYVPATVDGSPIVYKMAAWNITRLFKTAESLTEL
jgi:hypothetical protein